MNYGTIHRGYVIRFMRYEDNRANGNLYKPETLHFFVGELNLARDVHKGLREAKSSGDDGRAWLVERGYKPGYIVSVSGVYEIEERLVEDE